MHQRYSTTTRGAPSDDEAPLLEATPETIQALDDEHVAGSHVIERAVKLGAVLERPRGDVLKDPRAPVCLSASNLEIEALLAGEYTRVADGLRHAGDRSRTLGHHAFIASGFRHGFWHG
jgi:hypothetical protein